MIEHILSALDSLAGRKFAVIDGAHFDDLPSALQDLNLPLHPLYQEETDPDLQALGPFLVPLRGRAVARQLHALADGQPALVWWSWPDTGEQTEEGLYRHIRSINLVEVPAGASPQFAHDDALHPTLDGAEDHLPHDCGHAHHDHGENPIRAARQTYEPALFRHADPNVMAALLPVLNGQQVSRLFDRAGGLVLQCLPSHEVLRFARPGYLPLAPKGMLRLLPAQYASLARV